MFRHHYDDWIESRMNGVRKYVTPDFFTSKTLLEVGCGHAHIGNKFSEMGAIVTSSDARKEHLDVVNTLYPHIQTLLIDGDNMEITDKYDIVVHWGVLYHLNEIETHLEIISKKCNVLFLETEVSDADDSDFRIMVDENGYDQAFNKKGIRPSPSYVEKVLAKNGFEFKLIQDSVLDSGFHNYNWEIENTKTWRHGLRRFWICWKDTPTPLN